MTNVDWIIIGLYMAGLIAMSVFVGRGQEDAEDYYVGGRNLPWWAVGLSTMATQCSVVSFISIPAFVAMKEGGGLTWLQYEVSVPLAMVAVMVLLIPLFRKLELVSVYAYLEMRFGLGVRLLISAVFLVSRGLGTGVGIYTTALVLQVCTGLSLGVILLLVGIITIVYDTIGGMSAVVWSDVIQLVVIFVGIFVCIGFAIEYAGGLDAALAAIPPERTKALSMGTGLGDGAAAPFLAYLIGGFFLYVAYYGTDQSQTQRELSAPTLDDTKRSLMMNGFGRAPLTGLYLLLGLATGAAYLELPTLRALVEASKPDYLIPYFVVHHLPEGIRAVLVAAMLAAGMSSLDSALNSLSAATMQDFVLRYRPLEPAAQLRASKRVTIAWGIAITGFGFFVDRIADTVLEAVNKIGSAFNGPILATFIIGVLVRRVSAAPIVLGVGVGVASNLALWLFDAPVHFMWWNAIGFIVTVVVAVAASFVVTAGPRDLTGLVLRPDDIRTNETGWGLPYAALMGYAALIVLIAIYLGVTT
ncbi:MAG: sodium/solute symporter [Myxococcota bacterium]